MKKRLLFLPILLFMALSFFMLLSRSPVEIMTGWASDTGLLRLTEDRAEPGFIDIGGIVARFTDSIPEHIRAFQLVSVILISFGLLFLLMSLPVDEPNVTAYAILLATIFFNPFVLGQLLNLEGYALPFFLIALSVMLFRRKGIHSFFIGLTAGLAVYSGWGYGLFVVGFLPFLGEHRKRLWKIIGLVAGFGTALIPMTIWQLYPISLDIYGGGHSLGFSFDSGLLHRLTGLGSLLCRSINIVAVVLFTVFLTKSMVTRKEIRPFAMSALVMLAADFFFGTGLWPFYLLAGYALASTIQEDKARNYIPTTAIGLLLFILLLLPSKRDISTHLEMGRYIGRTGIEGIVAFRPGLLSIVSGQEIAYPPRSNLSPRDALLNLAGEKGCRWAIVVLSSEMAEETFSTFETSPIPSMEGYRLCLLSIEDIPRHLELKANTDHF